MDAPPFQLGHSDCAVHQPRRNDDRGAGTAFINPLTGDDPAAAVREIDQFIIVNPAVRLEAARRPGRVPHGTAAQKQAAAFKLMFHFQRLLRRFQPYYKTGTERMQPVLSGFPAEIRLTSGCRKLYPPPNLPQPATPENRKIGSTCFIQTSYKTALPEIVHLPGCSGVRGRGESPKNCRKTENRALPGYRRRD